MRNSQSQSQARSARARSQPLRRRLFPWARTKTETLRLSAAFREADTARRRRMETWKAESAPPEQGGQRSQPILFREQDHQFRSTCEKGVRSKRIQQIQIILPWIFRYIDPDPSIQVPARLACSRLRTSGLPSLAYRLPGNSKK